MPAKLQCAFCENPNQPTSTTLFPGPDVCICADCVAIGLQNILKRQAVGTSKPSDNCEFCRRPATKVKWMHAAHGHRICSDCLTFCIELALAELTAKAVG